MKVIFMGTPEFAVPALNALIEDKDITVSAVFTATPKKQGRGMQIINTPVYEVAHKNNITIFMPSTLKTVEIENIIKEIEADIIVVCAYGFIIPRSILYSKEYGSINIHPSDLPKYRGAAPIQRTVINGEKETAVCIMQMDEGLDTGAVIIKEKFPLHDKITSKELHDKCAKIGAKLLIHTLHNINHLPKIPQPLEGSTYAHKLQKIESKVQWANSAYQIDCLIRGLGSVNFSYNNKSIKILDADIEYKEHNITPGTVVDNVNFKVACNNSFLIIKKLQQEGKKVLDTKDFLLGFTISVGDILN